MANAERMGAALKSRLMALMDRFPFIGDVRGKGLMIGTEFVVDGGNEKAKPLVKQIIHAAEERDLLLLSCGTYDNTIRWIPPLNVTSDQINDGLRIFSVSLKQVLG